MAKKAHIPDKKESAPRPKKTAAPEPVTVHHPVHRHAEPIADPHQQMHLNSSNQ